VAVVDQREGGERAERSRHHPVARLDPVDAGPDGLDLAGQLQAGG
jgi:hypothetical protein